MQFIPMLVIVVLVIGGMQIFGKKQRRVAAQKAALLANAMVPGARVMTTSGMHATVTAVADDTIELEIAPGIRTTWVRAAVREVVVAVPESEMSDSDTEDFVADQVQSIDEDHISLDKGNKDVG